MASACGRRHCLPAASARRRQREERAEVGEEEEEEGLRRRRDRQSDAASPSSRSSSSSLTLAGDRSVASGTCFFFFRDSKGGKVRSLFFFFFFRSVCFLVSFSSSSFSPQTPLTSDAAPSSAAFSTSQSPLPPLSPSAATARLRRGSGTGATETAPSTLAQAAAAAPGSEEGLDEGVAVSCCCCCSSSTALAIRPRPSQSSRGAPGRSLSTLRAWRASPGGSGTTAPPPVDEACESRSGSTKKRGGRFGAAAARFSSAEGEGDDGDNDDDDGDDDDDADGELVALVAVVGSWLPRPGKSTREEAVAEKVEGEDAAAQCDVAAATACGLAAAVAGLAIAPRISCAPVSGGRISVRLETREARGRDSRGVFLLFGFVFSFISPPPFVLDAHLTHFFLPSSTPCHVFFGGGRAAPSLPPLRSSHRGVFRSRASPNRL